MKSSIWTLALGAGLAVGLGAGAAVAQYAPPTLTDPMTMTPPPVGGGVGSVAPSIKMPTPTKGRGKDAARICGNGESSAQPEKRVAACTDLIDSGNWQGKEAAAVYANRCVGYFQLGQNDKALSDCDVAAKLDPQSAVAYQYRAEIRQKRHEPDLALTDYDKAVELGADSAAIFTDRANLLLSRGETDKALADYDKAVALDSHSVSYLANRGNAWLAKGDAQKALADFDKAVELAPKNSIALMGRGVAGMALGDKAKAAADFKQALALAPADAYAALWLFLAEGGDAAAKAKLKGELPKADAVSWPWPLARHYLGDIAEADALAAAKAPGEKCEAQLYLGEARVLDKSRDEATPYFRQAVEICPKDFLEYFAASVELKKAEAAPAEKK